MNSDDTIRTDVLVYGTTPAGIAAALRAARGGLRVLLVSHARHVGGMMANGLLLWDALSDARRAPIFAEVLVTIENHYRRHSGAGSNDHRNATYSAERYPVGQVEPHVIERIFRDLLAAEPNITLRTGWYVARVRRRYDKVESVLLREMRGDGSCAAEAKVFLDAGSEGDLAALAGVPYRVGREGHDETGEPHAGRLYTQVVHEPAPPRAIAEACGLRPYTMRMGGVDPRSPRTGDCCVQAYNLRPVLTTNPDAGVPLTQPPPAYRRDDFVPYLRKSLGLLAGPSHLNHKSTYNAAILPGRNWQYPEGTWPQRRRCHEEHRDFALGLMWFLQNDPSVGTQRDVFRQFRLCADEWVDNGHLPEEMYVRETRRILARHVLSEHDLSPQPATNAARAFDDSVAFTDWYMDSHSCDEDATYGEPCSADFPYDGKLILTEQMRPGQVPYRCLLPRGVDNLLVPVCLGATHVAWGAVRLEPCLMHLGEVAGFAAVAALRDGRLPGTLDPAAFAASLPALGVQTTMPRPAAATTAR